jgi:fucose permease
MKKINLTILYFLLFSLHCFSQENDNATIGTAIIKNGIGMGSVIAIVISWDRHKTILYAIIHGLFGWLYVIYYALFLEKWKTKK